LDERVWSNPSGQQQPGGPGSLGLLQYHLDGRRRRAGWPGLRGLGQNCFRTGQRSRLPWGPFLHHLPSAWIGSTFRDPRPQRASHAHLRRSSSPAIHRRLSGPRKDEFQESLTFPSTKRERYGASGTQLIARRHRKKNGDLETASFRRYLYGKDEFQESQTFPSTERECYGASGTQLNARRHSNRNRDLETASFRGVCGTGLPEPRHSDRGVIRR
jgi:hypothetical protein